MLKAVEIPAALNGLQGMVDLLSKIAAGASPVLLLDYDGTLAPFQQDPSKAVPYPGVADLLRRINAFQRGRLMIVSGRQAAEVYKLLGVERVEVWGCHGFERLRADGTLETAKLDEATTAAIEETEWLLDQQGLRHRMESKPTARAVHWRGLPETVVPLIREKVEAVWSQVAASGSLRLLRFDGGMEICAAAKNKGDVVKGIADSAGENSAIAYLGDDVTDEDAFRAIAGRGLGVLVREQFRETAATAWLRPPDELMVFLNEWVEACRKVGV